jgi:GSH-dependent disulfide-bond oxidoreductase
LIAACRGEPELEDPGAAGSQRPEADPRVRVWLDPAYLAEKFGAFLPKGVEPRTETLKWLFWHIGSAPYLGGRFGHFDAYAPTKVEYAIGRFAMEVKRQLDVLNRRLADRAYLTSNEYTIADIAVFPWYGDLAKGWQYGAAEFL